MIKIIDTHNAVIETGLKNFRFVIPFNLDRGKLRLGVKTKPFHFIVKINGVERISKFSEIIDYYTIDFTPLFQTIKMNAGDIIEIVSVTELEYVSFTNKTMSKNLNDLFYLEYVDKDAIKKHYPNHNLENSRIDAIERRLDRLESEKNPVPNIQDSQDKLILNKFKSAGLNLEAIDFLTELAEMGYLQFRVEDIGDFLERKFKGIDFGDMGFFPQEKFKTDLTRIYNGSEKK